MLSPYLMIGQITKPQGVLGEMKVQPHTGDVNRFLKLQTVYLKRGEAYEAVTVTGARVSGGAAYITLPGILDRDAAEAMRGTALYVDRENAVPLAQDEAFICDLIGCEAVDTAGHLIGKLIDVLQPGATDVYVFETPRGRMLMPALKAAIPSVDVHALRIVLDAEKLEEVAFFED